MHNFPSTAPGDAHIDAVHLYRLWDAEEDRHYAHRRDWPTWDGQHWASPVTDAQTGLVAVRTPDGEGRVTTQAGQTLTLTRDTVLILPWADLASWRTTDDHWRLWWFEFFMLEPAHAQPYTPLDLPYTDAEEARIKAEEEAALATAKSEAEAEALKAKQEAEAAARAAEEARLKAEEEKRIAEAQAKAEAEAKARAEEEAQRQAAEEQRLADEKAAAEQAEVDRLEAEALAAEKAKEKRLREEALEAERRAKVAAQAAEREAAEREAREKLEAEREAKRRQDLIDQGIDPDAETDTLAEGGFLTRITKGLSKSTSRMTEQVSAAFTKRTLDADALEDLEDILITSDFGVGPASKVTALLAKDKFEKQVTDMEIKIALADVISEILTPLEKPIVLTSTKPQIMLFVGVNGSGKTTTLGKLAKRYHDQGKKVMIAAGDTFRAAAVEQLTVWSERAGAKIVSGKLGSDAAGLVYDAIEQAKNEDVDILMIDTAGRLQNRTELMDELAKVVRVIKKQDPSAPHHSILVLDATVGQNALMQTEAFAETAGVTGLVMTKLDGTAKGGVLVALSDKYQLPIHAIGIGERMEDLENFSAPVFAAALSGVADVLNAS